jgi:hypothetical protein
MEIKGCVCAIVIFSLLVFSFIETAWAEEVESRGFIITSLILSSSLAGGCIVAALLERNPVDSDGNIITEEEIKADMGATYYGFGGCQIAGCCLGSTMFIPYAWAAMLVTIGIGDGHESDIGDKTFAASLALEAATIAAFVYIGRRYDRHRSIQRIRDKRQWQEKHVFGGQGIIDGYYLPMLKATF